MKACEKINDKLIFFDELPATDKREIESHLEGCEDCRKKLHDFQNIMSSIKYNQPSHFVEDDLLMRYSLYLAAPDEPDYDGQSLSRAEIGTIKQHAAECEECRKKIERFQQDYQEIETYLDAAELPDLNLGVQPALPRILGHLKALPGVVLKQIKTLSDLSLPRFYPVAVGAMAALFIVIWMGPFFRGNENPYWELAMMENEKASFLTRGNTAATLADGLNAFNEGRYDRAIVGLEGFIAENNSDPSKFYAHYILGIAYLNTARSDFLGRFKKVDAEMLAAGKQNLAIAKGMSENAGISEGCDWYTATALLLEGDVKQARERFAAIADLKGRRYQAAKEKLAELDELMQE